MNRLVFSRVWAVLGIGVAVLVGLGLLLALLARGPGDLAPMITPLPAPQSDEPVVASVNGNVIPYSRWVEAALLDQVLSGLAGKQAPTPEETLERLVNEELVLQAVSPEQTTSEQIEAQIASLEQNWGVDDQAVIAALTESGLTRAVLEREIGRLLSVQAGQDTLRGRGYDTTDWIAKQRAKAEIVIYRNVAVLPPLPTRSPVPTPSSPLPSPAGPFAQVAPDFTLDRAGGGTFTLIEQLAQGPVVLVFFQKCG